MLSLFLIPVAILLLCLFMYYVVGKSFNEYFSSMEERSSLLQKVLLLVMTKDIVSFFASPDANRIVDLLFEEAQTSKEDIEEKLLDSVESAGPAIENLYASLKRAYAPSASINRARSASTLLKLNILLYGVVVSVSEALELYFAEMLHVMIYQFLNGAIFGGTVIFAVVLASMAVFIYNETRKVDYQVESVSDPENVATLTE